MKVNKDVGHILENVLAVEEILGMFSNRAIYNLPPGIYLIGRNFWPIRGSGGVSSLEN